MPKYRVESLQSGDETVSTYDIESPSMQIDDGVLIFHQEQSDDDTICVGVIEDRPIKFAFDNWERVYIIDE